MRPMLPGLAGRTLFVGVALLGGVGAGAGEPGRQWHALPVEGGVDTLARAGGLEPGLPAWRVLYEACRRRHGLWGEDVGAFDAEPAASSREAVVPLPLAPASGDGC